MSFSKIVLKSTTKMSLNDRFTGLRYENPSPNNGANSMGKEHRQAMQASRKNQRLAAQMENRPAVLAALKKEKFQNIQHRLNGQQTVSVKQRLAVAGRLSLPESKRSDLRTRGFQVRGRGRGLSRGIQNGNTRVFHGRDRFRGIGARVGQNFVPGRERVGGSFRGGRGRGVARGRGRGIPRGFRIGF